MAQRFLGTGRILALVVAAAATVASLHAQQGSPAQAKASIVGTLYDPAGHPADNTLLVVVATAGSPTLTEPTRTDEQGRFQFDIPPGPIAFRTPSTDVIDPATLEVAAGTTTVAVRMGIDAVAANLRVCRRCRQQTQVTKVAPAATTGALPAFAGAEPEEGWDTFNERSIPYPASLSNTTLQGEVVLEGRVTVDGATADLRSVSASNARLVGVARELAEQVRWRPAHIRDVPVSTPVRLTVEFTTNGDR